MKKRFLSSLLVLCMLLAMLPSTAWAAGNSSHELIDEWETLIIPDIDPSNPPISWFVAGDNTQGQEDAVPVKNPTAEKMIDRLELPKFATDFYELLERETKEDGCLVDFSKAKQQTFNYSSGSETAYVLTMPYDDGNTYTSDYIRNCMYAAYYSFDRDHPEVFWLDHVSYTNRAWEKTIYVCLKDVDPAGTHWDMRIVDYQDADMATATAKIKTDIQRLEASVNKIVADANAKASNNYEKIEYFNEWLTKNNQYNYYVAYGGRPEDVSTDIAHESISALTPKNEGDTIGGRIGGDGPVCEAYSRAFKLLCQKAGIPCVLVDGADQLSHMWNFVKPDPNDPRWYAVDVTWNDPTPSSKPASEQAYREIGAASGSDCTRYTLVGADTKPSGSDTFSTSHPTVNQVWGSTAEGKFVFVDFGTGPELNKTAYTDSVTITGLDAPVKGGTPDSTATLNAVPRYGKVYDSMYSPGSQAFMFDSITWTDESNNGAAVTGNFAASTVYAANIVYKTPRGGTDTAPGYALTAADAKKITVEGAPDVTITVNGDTKVIKVVFPVTSDKDAQIIAASEVNTTYGDSSTITASVAGAAGTSGTVGTLSYEVTEGGDVISVDGNGAITTHKAGTAKVTITAAETDTYTEATKVITVTVGKAVLTAEAGTIAAVKEYDGTTAVDVAKLTGAIALNGKVNNADNVSAKVTSGTYNSADVASANTATLTFELTGSDADNYTINQTTVVAASASITPKNIAGAQITLTPTSLTYNGQEQTVTPATVKVGALTLSGNDYTVSGNSGTNANTYTVTLTGKGNYTGTAAKDFTIARADYTFAPSVPTTTVKVGADRPAGGAASATVAGDTITGTLTWDQSGTFDTIGTETLHWTFTPDGTNTNYVTTEKTGSVTFTVNDLDEQTLTFDTSDASVVYGETLTRAATTVAGGGTINYSSSEPGVATVNIDGEVTATGVGTTVITATAARVEGQWAETNASYTLTVTAKPVAVTAEAKTKTYGDRDPELTYTADALVGTDSFTGALSRASGEDVGTYTINQGTLTAGSNYVITFTSAGLTVNKARISNPVFPDKTVLVNTAQTGVQVDLSSVLSSAGGWKDVQIQCGGVTGSLVSNVSASGTVITFDVAAVEAIGETSSIDLSITSKNYETASAVLTVKTANKDDAGVTLGAVSDKTYSDADFTVTGSVSDSGTGAGVWTWTSSDPSVLTVTGTGANATVTITGVGSATITGKYESDSTVGSATTATLNVAKGTITITAQNKSISVGGAVPDLTSPVAGTDYTITGLRSGESLAAVPALAYASTPDPATAGSVAINVSGAAVPAGKDDCYHAIVYVPGLLTIANKLAQPLVFIPDVMTKVYGDADFTNAVNGAADGSIVTYTSSDPDVATVDSTGKVQIRKPGVTTITANATATEDYAAASLSYELTVNKAVITITAQNIAVTQGSAVPDLSTAAPGRGYTVTGLVGGDTLAVEPTLAFATTPDMSQLGTVTIHVSGAVLPEGKDAYYDAIVYHTGTMTIVAKTPTPTPAPSTPSGGGSSGGGSSSDSVNRNVTTSTTGGGSASITTTTIVPNTTVSGGTASTQVSSGDVNEAINQARSRGSETVVIAPKTSDNVDRSEVTIPAGSVGQLASRTSADLVVKTPAGDVTFPNRGLDGLSREGGSVVISTERSGSTIDLTITAGGSELDSVSGGVTLRVAQRGTDAGTVAVLVRANGSREVIRKSAVTDGTVNIPLSGSARVEIVNNGKSFRDVSASNWAAGAVAFASSHELFNGTAEDTFSPDLTMTRGMLAVVLHNLENNPDSVQVSGFPDVAAGAYYARAVAWAAEQGIVSGYANGNFGPNDSVTREQLALMLYRAAGSPSVTSNRIAQFADAGSISSYARTALNWAVENGIMNGIGNNLLNPQGQATRAQVAQMLKNYVESQF